MFKRFFAVIIGVVILVLTGSAFLFDAIKRRDLSPPFTYFAGNDIGLLSKKDVDDFVTSKINSFLDTPILMTIAGDVQQITPRELGAEINIDYLKNKISTGAKMSPISIASAIFYKKKINPKISIDLPRMKETLSLRFVNVKPARNARFVKVGNDIRIEDGLFGEEINYTKFIADWEVSAATLNSKALWIETYPRSPDLTAIDLAKYEQQIMKAIPKEIVLEYNQRKWIVPIRDHPEILGFSKIDTPLPIEITFSQDLWGLINYNEIKSAIEYEPEDVRLLASNPSDIEKGIIDIEGHGNDGQNIDQEKLLQSMNNVFKGGDGIIQIPIVVLPFKIDIADELQQLGIKELVAVGHSRFAGSPENRKHNIGVGIKKYNGLLIKPGEVFSFNAHLGEVNENAGFKKELVIKPEGTIPEFGGGLCQVSTTLFRAAINAGFPILERQAHSYAVTYYSQVGGHGLDATIYPPYRDMKFKNDSPGYIAIQSYVEGVDAYYKFYGTADGRKVELEGPQITNKRSAPSEEVLFTDNALPPGQKEQVQKPYGGFDAKWTRKIYKGEEVTSEDIFSRYQAVPAKFRVGPTMSAEGENQGLVPKFENAGKDITNSFKN